MIDFVSSSSDFENLEVLFSQSVLLEQQMHCQQSNFEFENTAVAISQSINMYYIDALHFEFIFILIKFQ